MPMAIFRAESVMEELRKNPPKLIERWWIHDYMYGLRKKACDMEEVCNRPTFRYIYLLSHGLYIGSMGGLQVV